MSCRCSGANASANASAASRSARLDQRGRRRRRRAAGRSRLERVEQRRASALAAPRRGPRPVLGLGEQVERDAGRAVARRRRRARSSSLGPGEAVDARRGRTAGAWPPGRRALPGPTITSTARRLGAVGERGDRLGAAHPVDLVDAAQRARGEDHGVARRRPGGAAPRPPPRPRPARSRAHHHRARIGRAPAGDVDRGAAHRHLAQQHRWPCGSVTSRSVAQRRPARPPRRWRSRPRAPARTPGQRRRAPRRARRRSTRSGRARRRGCRSAR